MNLSGKVAGLIVKHFVADDETGPAAAGLIRLCDDIAGHLVGDESPLAGAEAECIVSISKRRAGISSKSLIDGKMHETVREGTQFKATFWLPLKEATGDVA